MRPLRALFARFCTDTERRCAAAREASPNTTVDRPGCGGDARHAIFERGLGRALGASPSASRSPSGAMAGNPAPFWEPRDGGEPRLRALLGCARAPSPLALASDGGSCRRAHLIDFVFQTDCLGQGWVIGLATAIGGRHVCISACGPGVAQPRDVGAMGALHVKGVLNSMLDPAEAMPSCSSLRLAAPWLAGWRAGGGGRSARHAAGPRGWQVWRHLRLLTLGGAIAMVRAGCQQGGLPACLLSRASLGVRWVAGLACMPMIAAAHRPP